MATHPSDESLTTESVRANIDTIKKLTHLAGLCGGSLFGGYLRSLIQADWTPADITWKDIDIWFRTQTDADRFVTAAGPILTPHKLGMYSHQRGHYDYPFARRQYSLEPEGVTLAYIDVIVADDFPGNDFDINMLSAQPCSSFPYWEIQNHSHGLAVPYLIEKIKRKEAQMRPSYALLCSIEPPIWNGLHVHAERVAYRYLGQGWKISMPDGTPLNVRDNRPKLVIQFAQMWVDKNRFRLMTSATFTKEPETVEPSPVAFSPVAFSPVASPASIGTKDPEVSGDPIHTKDSKAPDTSEVPTPANTLAQIALVLTQAIERRHEAAIIGLLGEIQELNGQGPPARVLESFKPRVQALIAETRQDLLKELTVVQTCQQLLDPK